MKQNQKLSLELSYIMGVILGDGSYFFNKLNRNYVISLKSIDMDFIIKFKKQIKIEFDKKCYVYKEKSKTCKLGYCYRLICYSKKIFDIISFYELSILKIIKNYPKNIQLSFLNGIFDSEGYVSNPKYHKRLGLACNDKKIIISCKKIFSNFNIDTHIYESIKRNKSYYDLYICGRKNILLCQKYLDSSIKRKRDRIDNLINSYCY